MYVPFYVFCFIVLFCVLFMCKFVVYYYHRTSTQLQLTDIYLLFSPWRYNPHRVFYSPLAGFSLLTCEVS